MSTVDHLAIAPEVTFGTMVTPTNFYEVISMTPTRGQTFLEQRTTGTSSGLSTADIGAFKPTGTIEAPATPELMGVLFKAMLNSVNSTQIAATTAYTHVFEPDDDAALNSISLQMQRIGAGTTITTNARGCRVTRIAINSTAEQYVTVTFDYLALEQLKAGETFDDTTASPAAQTPTYPTDIEWHSFQSGAVTHGGTPSSDGTTDVWSIAAGTSLSNIESINFEINWNMSQRMFINSRYPGKIVHGNLDVSGSITLDNDVPSMTFADLMRLGTKQAIDWKTTTIEEIEATHNYELQVTLPLAQYRVANAFDGMSGDTSPRSIQVDFVGTIFDSENTPVALYVKDSQTSY